MKVSPVARTELPGLRFQVKGLHRIKRFNPGQPNIHFRTPPEQCYLFAGNSGKFAILV